ncbi:hypothetical protein EYZ11_006018 [Aspergillus tanneri]|uniref:ribonuclease Z n=1 Tax=Aspergillus tanneri TaxID=1220188 RepID=A0A4S3JH25_9EURO|nr:hypothetical protein EYZ11_006018 [Aspergillus tanneri]
MKFYYQVVTTPTADTPGTSLLLHFPDKRYFFGQISEGTQRACTERGVRLSFLTDIFITGRIEWQNTGGLIGTILTQADGSATSSSALETTAREKAERRTQADNKKPGASPKQEHATARRFVFRRGMPVFTREYDSESVPNGASVDVNDPFQQPSWSDNNIKVWAMPVSPSSVAQGNDAPQRPRKRSLDEFQENNIDTSGDIDQRTRDQITRQAIVTDMFNSSWRMDALVETRLADVKMPAVMFVRNPETKSLEEYKGPAPGSNTPLPNIKVFVRQPWPGATVEKIPPTSWSREAVSYVVRNHDIRGKFDPAKAQELKVRKGGDYGKLTKGESVLSEDQKVITPEMVLGPPRLGKGIAIIDLPTPDYVENLVNRPEWNSPSVTTNLEAFVWILGPGVGDHPQLRKFIARMSHCKHTVSGTDYTPNYLALASVACSSIRMAQLRRENHPVPVHDNVTLPQPGTSTDKSKAATEKTETLPFEPLEPGLIINMEPKFEFNRSEVVRPFNAAEVVQQKMPAAVEKRMNTIGKRVKKHEFQQKLDHFLHNLPGSNVEIITLGTGSSSPSKYRNVSSTLVNVPGYGYYLFDCGESTLGQLKRVFGHEKLREVLRNLRLVWISHLHADHHLGTASLIKAWFQENYPHGIPRTDNIVTDMSKILKEKRLFLVSEEMMIRWLEEYAGVEDYGFSKLIPVTASPFISDNKIQTRFSYRHCCGDGSYPEYESENGSPQTTALAFDEKTSPLAPLLREATGLSDLLTTKVSHCKGAMAVSLVFSDGFKISFSGDCRPSPAFAAIGHGSTVLIHEATFHDNMKGSAIAKRHSTTVEALEVGRLMEARAIILTHFSQRYQKFTHVEREKTSLPTKQEETIVQPPEHPDIPDEEPDTIEGQGSVPPLQFDSNYAVKERPRLNVPVVGAFDYMHIRVGDMPYTQAYAPAIDKLYQITERASAEETEKRKLELEKQAAIVMEKKALKHARRLKLENKAAAPDTTNENMEIDEMKPPKHSAWSASESESGWSTSGDEKEIRIRRRSTPRKQESK